MKVKNKMSGAAEAVVDAIFNDYDIRPSGEKLFSTKAGLLRQIKQCNGFPAIIFAYVHKKGGVKIVSIAVDIK